MSRWTRTGTGLIVLCTLWAYNNSSPIHGQTAPQAAPTEARDAAFARFNAAHGGKWTADWNPVTGTPHRISGSSIELPEAVTEKNVEALSRTVIEKYREVLKADPRALVLN